MRLAVVINKMEESLRDSDFPKQGLIYLPQDVATLALPGSWRFKRQPASTFTERA